MCILYSLIRFILFNDKEDDLIIGIYSLSEKNAYFLAIISIINLSLFLFQGPLIISFLN